MQFVPGTLQRQLHPMVCEWGRERAEFQVTFPVFDGGYKVLGILALNVGEVPVWYPSVPAAVEQQLLRFKAPYQEDGPRPVHELEEPVFAGTYLCDPWHAALLGLRQLVPFGNPDREWPLPTDLFERTSGGESLIDVVYEPALHRVRGFVFRRLWYWRKRVSVLALPALRDALDPPAESHQVLQRPAPKPAQEIPPANRRRSRLTNLEDIISGRPSGTGKSSATEERSTLDP